MLNKASQVLNTSLQDRYPNMGAGLPRSVDSLGRFLKIRLLGIVDITEGLRVAID